MSADFWGGQVPPATLTKEFHDSDPAGYGAFEVTLALGTRLNGHILTSTPNRTLDGVNTPEALSSDLSPNRWVDDFVFQFARISGQHAGRRALVEVTVYSNLRCRRCPR